MSVRGASSARAMSLPRPPWRRWLRALGWVLGGVLLLECLLNLALNTGLIPALIHRAVPRLRLGWSEAWWLWPGQAHARGFFLEHQGAHERWRVEADEVEGKLSVAALFSRRVEAGQVRARGVRARLEPLPTEERTPPRPPRPHPWRVELRDLEVQDARELAWGTTHYLGPADARGTVRVIAGQRLTVDAAHVHLAGGFVEEQGQRLARLEELSAGFSLEATRRHPEGWDVLGGLSGRLQAKADLLPLDWLGARLSRHAEVSLHDGAGTLEADVSIQRGRVEPGSRVEARGAPLTLRLGPARVHTPWHALGLVKPDAHGTPHGRLQLTFAPVRLEGPARRVLELPEVALTFHVEPRLEPPAPSVRSELHVAPSGPVDLRLLNTWTGETFRVDSGSATLKAAGHRDSEHASGAMHLMLDTDLVEARVGDTRLLGRASAELDARRLSLRGKTLGLNGTTLRLSQVSADLDNATVRGWSGTFALPQATLSLSPPELEARFSGTFANADPFVALLSRHKRLPHFLAPLLHTRELQVTGRLRLGDPGIQVRELHVQGENLEIQGQVDLSRGATHALVLATVGGVTGGVEVTPGGTHLHLDDARHWFEERLAAPPP
ncbi:hypothetical protein [Archangium violaceum]|uniref:hypothetical protein n=1 Tax=Archangium violaceum TaxID=83451 RepID=UPI0036D7C92E